MKTLTLEKITKIIRGAKAPSYYGDITIQCNREARAILVNGYCITNVSSAYERRYRISWIEGKKYKTTGRVSFSRIKHILSILKNDKKYIKLLKKNNIDKKIIFENLSTNGYTGLYILTCLLQGKKPNAEKLENLKIAHNRHNLTDYDSISKKNLSDYQVRELRRFANSLV